MIGITVVAVFIVMAAMSVKNIFDLRAEEKVLMAENAELLQLKEEMLLKLDNVNSDEFIEEQARKELKLVKGNELIFYFPEDWEVKEQEAKDSKKETEKKDE
jgi:cell division protein DivIC